MPDVYHRCMEATMMHYFSARLVIVATVIGVIVSFAVVFGR